MHDSLSLQGQNILITGVSRSLGIGTGIARQFAKAGANLALHGYSSYDQTLQYPDASENFSTSLVKELRQEKVTVSLLKPSDLSKPDEPFNVIASAKQQLGSLNGLILNHAYSVNASIMEDTAENIDRHLAVNVRAAILMMQAFTKQIPKKGGVITLFTSGQYLGSMIKEIAYAVSKEAIRCLCSHAAVALAPYGIRVNCINPGPTDTGYLSGSAYEAVAKMFPSGKWGTPEDAAKLVHFLHSDHASWITGQIIASEGGFQR